MLMGRSRMGLLARVVTIRSHQQRLKSSIAQSHPNQATTLARATQAMSQHLVLHCIIASMEVCIEVMNMVIQKSD